MVASFFFFFVHQSLHLAIHKCKNISKYLFISQLTAKFVVSILVFGEIHVIFFLKLRRKVKKSQINMNTLIRLILPGIFELFI